MASTHGFMDGSQNFRFKYKAQDNLATGSGSENINPATDVTLYDPKTIIGVLQRNQYTQHAFDILRKCGRLHELRTPLTAITIFVPLYIKEPPRSMVERRRFFLAHTLKRVCLPDQLLGVDAMYLYTGLKRVLCRDVAGTIILDVNPHRSIIGWEVIGNSIVYYIDEALVYRTLPSF